ncbi:MULTISPECIES: DEAD/DEAH box helicase [Novosphingobium]|uniref:DEAD/DEAH box helicase n=1 Tax=Novosphingobium TaxID=165696 RepID=UPI0022F24B20|nr:DEAD/DEAH box helicase [Novosphingobium resinovorum]MEE4454792.1 DEAD/DEAH box helicase [Novosphingobium resinovorum]GLK44029.1 ATP-dependent helicase HepA [Novosphingobium resinovorum]
MNAVVFAPGDMVRARGREWIVLPSPGEGMLNVRPLSGSDDDAQIIIPELESSPVEPASFAAPTADRLDTQDGAKLLADALRLSLRRGAGPFRSAAHLGVEPRAYQLVPLMMALKLHVARLLIADDVGIGKTIESGMILREWLDRGLVDRFAVLCPPHLVDQWVTELAEKFDIDAVAVTAAKARGLERGLPTSQSLFDAYPFTVVSLDYIKADSRRDEFARACPPFVIVDEAHSCVGNERGKHQRYDLLERIATDPERHLLLLTATPHSGDVVAYDRLLGLVHKELAGGPNGGDANARERYARRLAQHLIQRRRPDIQDGWDEQRAFAKHETKESPFTLNGDFAAFQEEVLDYCFTVTERAGTDQRHRRLAFWGTLALMRCVGSSPAAAVSALSNRLSGMAEEDAIEPVVFDAEDGVLIESDIEPATAIEDSEETAALRALIERAQSLASRTAQDPKLKQLLAELRPLMKAGAKPVIFCRFIATAEALGEVLRAEFSKAALAVVTGTLAPDERRNRVEALDVSDNRILVATDCLSEGINLQSLFDTVIHYDLSWNPTRHQQREGRVDRFGQQAPIVRSLMMYGENSAIDGAVLDVILRKADEIRKATGVAVPMPEDQESVTSALMQAVMLRRGGNAKSQLTFDFGPAAQRFERQWRDTAENAKASRSRYAQGALKPDEVLPEWNKMRALNGGPTEVARFTERALQRLGAPLEKLADHARLHIDFLPDAMRDRLGQRGLKGTRRISFLDDPNPGVTHVGRVHPAVAIMAETLAEGALDPQAAEGKALGRAGVWRTRAVAQMTTLLLLRLRYQLVTSGRTNRLLLAEEATAVAFAGLGTEPVAFADQALALLEQAASSDIDTDARLRQIDNAHSRLPSYTSAIEAFAQTRAEALSYDHIRLTEAAGGGATVKVNPVLPADIIGLYVLLPELN